MVVTGGVEIGIKDKDNKVVLFVVGDVKGECESWVREEKDKKR